MSEAITMEKTNLASYVKAGIKRVEWLIDDDACPQCKVFKGKEFDAKNAPIPGQDSHQGCRCTILPII